MWASLFDASFFICNFYDNNHNLDYNHFSDKLVAICQLQSHIKLAKISYLISKRNARAVAKKCCEVALIC